MQTVRKYLVYEYVPIMERTFRSGTRESCVAQRLIYVILRGDEETRSYINQVRNVLRHLLSDRIYECILIQNTLFQTSCFFIYSLRQFQKQICSLLKSNNVTILKYFLINVSSL